MPPPPPPPVLALVGAASPDCRCPWNFYRTSQDVRASFTSVVHNLETTVPFARLNLSFPGCWAYPDMLEVPLPFLQHFY